MTNSEQQLGRALLNIDTAASDDARAIAAAVQRRDRTNLIVIAAIMIFLWLLVAAGIALIAYGQFQLYAPREIAIVTNPDLLQQDGFRGSEDGLSWLMEMGFYIAVTTVVLLVLAAVSTALLVSVSRRVTLRQVDAKLTMLCQEMKKLEASLAEKR